MHSPIGCRPYTVIVLSPRSLLIDRCRDSLARPGVYVVHPASSSLFLAALRGGKAV